MELAAVHTVYDALAGDGTVFLYSGRFHDEHTAYLIALGEDLAEGVDGERNVRNKLGFIMVESYQNIVRHRAMLPEDMERHAGRSLFMVRADGADYEVVAMNAVPNAEVDSLKDLLERIRSLDLKQLKEMFLRGLQHNTATQRGGAGLGLIEMARRSGHGMQHRLAPVGPDHQLFTLHVRIGGGAAPNSSPAMLDRLHTFVETQDVLLLCAGRLSAGVQNTVLQMLAKDMDAGTARPDTWTRSYLAATELLGSVSLGDARPIVVIGRASEGHSFVVGTTMDSATAGHLQAEVDTINALEPGRVQSRYRDALLGPSDALGNAKRGLLDLARRKVRPVRILRAPVADGEFVLLEVMV